MTGTCVCLFRLTSFVSKHEKYGYLLERVLIKDQKRWTVQSTWARTQTYLSALQILPKCVVQGMKVSRYQSIKISRYQGIKVSRYQGIEVSRYRGIKVSRYQGIKVSRYQGIKVFRSKLLGRHASC
jgi:hypothetical protein